MLLPFGKLAPLLKISKRLRCGLTRLPGLEDDEMADRPRLRSTGAISRNAGALRVAVECSERLRFVAQPSMQALPRTFHAYRQEPLKERDKLASE